MCNTLTSRLISLWINTITRSHCNIRNKGHRRAGGCGCGAVTVSWLERASQQECLLGLIIALWLINVTTSVHGRHNGHSWLLWVLWRADGPSWMFQGLSFHCRCLMMWRGWCSMSSTLPFPKTIRIRNVATHMHSDTVSPHPETNVHSGAENNSVKY